MTFKDVLAQVIDWLQQDKRITYRALKRQFDLDDAYLEDLKAEIIQAKKLAVDEEGVVLVWAGASAIPDQLMQQPTIPEQTSSLIELRPTVPLPPDAERRQLTVMFCDLVDSTTLSSQLDPEEYRDVVRAYQAACTEVIQRFEGHVAQLLGDGLLVYFGYPQAHEDDAQRAVRTGLGILGEMHDLNTRLKREKGIQLALRLGIHTGLVVVGAMGGRGRQEQLALGETPNLAARIQGLAEPNTVLISNATSRLIQGYFECQTLGAQALRGVAEPVAVYRVLQESGARGRLDVAVTRGLAPLVGREQEVGLLMERWEQAKSGQGQVVLLSGDAGIGKSRLVQMLKEHVAQEPHTRWECRSSSYFDNTALFPVTDLFQRLLQFQAEDTPEEKVGKLEQMLSQYRLPVEETVPLFAPLLSLSISEHRYPPLNLSPQRQRQRTLETLIAILLELAEHQPVLFILEDLHWTDPTTLEWLNLVIDQAPTASILVLLTCRPTFQPTWSHRSYLTEITVNRLSHAQVAQLVNRMTDGKPLPHEVLAQVVEKTDGVPLFVEEITKAILESGPLKEVAGHYALTGSLSTFTIPTTLQDSLMARLDRLISAKGIAQFGAAIGRQFAYDVLQTMTQLDDATLQRELRRLVDAELVYQRGLPPHATYTFKHALIRDAAYQSLLKSTRQHYHQRIAQGFETHFPAVAAIQPELLAHHYTEAGLAEHALPYWHTAAQSALQRSAYQETRAHCAQGLETLETLAETPSRVQHELGLQTILAAALHAFGPAHPALAQVFNRTWQLCQQVDTPTQVMPILRGLSSFYNVGAQYDKAYNVGQRLLALAQQQHDQACLLEAYRALGTTTLYRGDVAESSQHFTNALGLYAAHFQGTQHVPQYAGIETGICCVIYSAHALWFLGYSTQAHERLHQGLQLAEASSYPFTRTWTLTWAARAAQARREIQRTLERAEAGLALAEQYGFAGHIPQGRLLRGWALMMQDRREAHLPEMRQQLAALEAMGTKSVGAYARLLLAEALREGAQAEAALTVLTEALGHMETTNEETFKAEAYRLKGELLLQQSSDHQAAAETCFHQAIATAQNQSAKSWELRATTSLARLWQQQGKRQEAQDLLAPVYQWFTEGFDTLDLIDAKALLDALSEGR